jgi:glycosyltransferase involved in cell wall biosynthesis
MAAARPVVASRTGGTPEIVLDGETGLLVAPGDAGAVAAAITTLLQDDQLGARFGRAGRLKVEREFTLDRHLAMMERLYREASSPGAVAGRARASS